MPCVDVTGVAIRFLLLRAAIPGNSLAEIATRCPSGICGYVGLQASDERVNCGKSDSRSNGYAEMKARAFRDRALDPEPPAMRFHNVTGDGKAQAGAAGLARTRGVHPIEAFKDALLLGLRDTNARISNGDHNPAIRAQSRNLDFPAGRRILQGIIEEIL